MRLKSVGFVLILALMLTLSTVSAQDPTPTVDPDVPVPLLPLNPAETVTFSFTSEPDTGELLLSFQPDFAQLEVTPGRYAWLMPVPAGSTFDGNYRGTRGRYYRNATGPVHTCQEIHTYGRGHGDGVGVIEATERGIVPANEISEWAASFNVELGLSAAAVEDYAADGYDFMTMILDMPDWGYYEDGTFGDGPIINSFAINWAQSRDTINIPVQTFTAHTDDPLKVNVNIDGAVQYAIDDLERVQIEPDEFDDWYSEHTLAAPIDAGLGGPWLSAAPLINANAAILTDGSFFTAWAFPDVYDGRENQGNTALRALTSSDFTVVPAPDEPWRADVDLTDEDPIALYDCSTIGLEDEPVMAQFVEAIEAAPAAMVENRMHIQQGVFSASAIYPVDWVYSIVDFEGDELPNPKATWHIYAPEAVTMDTLRAHANGEPTPPMFVLANNTEYWFIPMAYEYDLYTTLREGAYTENLVRYPDVNRLGPTEVWEENVLGVRTLTLATADQYAEHAVAFDAMHAYPQLFRYVLHPELRHTLYMAWPLWGEDQERASNFEALQIGFPAGFRPRLVSDDTILVLPEDAENDEADLGITLHTLTWDEAWADLPNDGDPDAFLDVLTERFSFTQEAVDAIIAYNQSDNTFGPVTSMCSLYSLDIPFSIARDGRQGYMVLRNNVTMITTPVDGPIGDGVLRAMADSLTVMLPNACG